MAGLMQQQATALAYTDVVSWMVIVVACLVPMTFLMKRPPKGGGDAPPMH
jgi:hypothetical protein